MLEWWIQNPRLPVAPLNYNQVAAKKQQKDKDLVIDVSFPFSFHYLQFLQLFLQLSNI